MTLLSLQRSDCLTPHWPAIPNVRALVTTRAGGVSPAPYGRGADGSQPGGLNLGLSTGDLLEHVQENRARLGVLCEAPLAWVEQVHGNTVVDAVRALTALKTGQARLKADASVTDAKGVACVVMVADCLPVLLADSAGRAVGAAHAGWRGLLAGVIENTATAIVQRVDPTAQLHAFLGPAIGPQAFEVGAEVRDAFLQAALPDELALTDRAFAAHPAHAGKFFCNLYALARLRLARVGVTLVTGGDHCTFSEPERFYSFRRARGAGTGRCAALIWRIQEAGKK